VGERLGDGGRLEGLRTGCRLRHARWVAAFLACVTVLLLGACSGTDLEVVSGPEAGQQPGTTTLAPLTTEPPSPGIADTIPTSTTTSSSTTTSTTAPTTTTSTTPEDGEGDPEDPGSGGTASPAAPWQPDLSAADQSVTFVNQKRAENGLGALTVDPELQADAEEWALQMAQEQRMYHDPNRGEKMPAQYGWWGENVAMGPDAAGLNQAWWESDGHRANMLGENYTAVGIAFVRDDAGTYWAVQVFGGNGS
jgi:uncharacterized protein YkwD